MDSIFLCLMAKNIYDSNETVSNIFNPFLRDLLSKISEICEKCSQGKCQKHPEGGSLVYWGDHSPPPRKKVNQKPCITYVRSPHKTLKKIPLSLRATSEPSMCVWGLGGKQGVKITLPSVRPIELSHFFCKKLFTKPQAQHLLGPIL